MSYKKRNSRTLKNTILSSRSWINVITLVVFFTLFASTNVDAQESIQWRRTKDGWTDMTEELRYMNDVHVEHNSTVWDSIWPAAATLSLAVSAYWVLTFDFRSIYGNCRQKLSKNALGRIIRQSEKTALDSGLRSVDGTIPALIPITEEMSNSPHR